jgi:hypothetical protein
MTRGAPTRQDKENAIASRYGRKESDCEGKGDTLCAQAHREGQGDEGQGDGEGSGQACQEGAACEGEARAEGEADAEGSAETNADHVESTRDEAA